VLYCNFKTALAPPISHLSALLENEYPPGGDWFKKNNIALGVPEDINGYGAAPKLNSTTELLLRCPH